MASSLARFLFEKDFSPASLIKLASMLYQKQASIQAGNLSDDWSSGIIATLHKSGNGLNYNPHVHIVATRELVNRKTGEISKDPYIPYHKVRILWMKTVCRLLVRKKIISKQDSKDIKKQFKYGFHVYFQPITGNENDVLFRTAEYMATGFFHNSQILKVDHDKKEVIFKFRSWPLYVHPCTQRHSPRPVARLIEKQEKRVTVPKNLIFMPSWRECYFFYQTITKK